MVLPGCIITSMGPYLQGSSFDKAFSSNGNFQNYVTGIEAYERMRERARHVSSESKAIAIRAAEARHLSTYGEPLQLPSCLAVIQNHCCYLSSPLLCGLNREEVSARMENLKSDIERIKFIFDQKVCKFICFTNFELNSIFIATYWNSRLHGGEKSVVFHRQHLYNVRDKILFREFLGSPTTTMTNAPKDQPTVNYSTGSPSVVSRESTPSSSPASSPVLGLKRAADNSRNSEAKKPRQHNTRKE